MMRYKKRLAQPESEADAMTKQLKDTLNAIKSVDQLEVWLEGKLVGNLGMTDKYTCIFQYDSQYAENGESISPFVLPISRDYFTADTLLFGGTFGVFADSLPDGWGNLVLDRYLEKHGINPHTLSVIERLSLIGSTGRGALEYRPDNSVRGALRPVDFDDLVRQVKELYQTKDCTEAKSNSINTIFHFSGSTGGARPKIFITAEGQEWLVKFPASIDPDTVGVQEYEYSLLAKKCGIIMPETRLFDGKYFGTQRFDRGEAGKVHTISAAGLLHVDYHLPTLDYSSLHVACLELTKDIREVEQLFRVMVFNVVIGNCDDHAKNFSFQLKNGKWKLSPAYDLLPCHGMNGEHFTMIDGQGNPSREHLLNCGLEASLDKDYMNSSIDEILDICHSENMARADLRVK